MSDKQFTVKDWASSKLVETNFIDTYNEQLAPLVEALQKRCQELGVPMVAVFGVQQTLQGDGTQVVQAMPEDVGKLGGNFMSVLCLANRVEMPAASIMALDYSRALKAGYVEVPCTAQ